MNTGLRLKMGHHMGVCKICKTRLAIGGGPEVGGYKVQAHHHKDLERAKKGELCPGSDSGPESYILDKR